MSPNKRLHDTARSPFYDCIAKHPRICFPSNDEPLIGVDVHLLLKHSGIPFSPEDIRETTRIQRWGDLVPHTRPPFWKKKRGRLSTRECLIHLVNISSTSGCIPVHCGLLVNVKENLSSLIECLFDDFRNRDVTDSELLNYVSPKVSVNDFTDHFTTR